MKRMVALAVLLVVGIVALWPRGRGPVVEAPTVEAVAVKRDVSADVARRAPSPETLAKFGAAPEFGQAGLDARVAALTAKGVPDADFIAERERRLWEIGTNPNSIRNAPVDEQIARLRSGEDWPDTGLIKGPPGKPALDAGATKEQVLAAWGEPARESYRPGLILGHSPATPWGSLLKLT